MVLYEVNLIIDNEIYLRYYDWLVDHIKKMLSFPGFQKAMLSREISGEQADKIKLTVRYTITSKQLLDQYLELYAKEMREEGIRKFGGSFTASRRIFEEVEIQ